MSPLANIEAGSRHDLRVGISPDAPDESAFHDDGQGAFGYVHSYETASRCDGPGLRVVLFVSGCLLRCSYCHNPDTWHLKDPPRQVRIRPAASGRWPDHLWRGADGAIGVHTADIGGGQGTRASCRD